MASPVSITKAAEIFDPVILKNSLVDGDKEANSLHVIAGENYGVLMSENGRELFFWLISDDGRLVVTPTVAPLERKGFVLSRNELIFAFIDQSTDVELFMKNYNCCIWRYVFLKQCESGISYYKLFVKSACHMELVIRMLENDMCWYFVNSAIYRVIPQFVYHPTFKYIW
ncbi:hypothetical protein RF11_01441 [Thelohanellus kitauei]|uniref:Uncharacterized protein n=1 Tax=Thelohanellus kitauei TaxID=669202 RepID=A0A0C2IDU3_THEKT|nr:hypothetical protein RF11_01441 [Thelohanellus kitauei]